jgi:hypothetical protein
MTGSGDGEEGAGGGGAGDEGDASHSREPTRAHDVLQPARLRRNAGNRRFFRARPAASFLAPGSRTRSRAKAGNRGSLHPTGARPAEEPPSQTRP